VGEELQEDQMWCG